MTAAVPDADAAAGTPGFRFLLWADAPAGAPDGDATAKRKRRICVLLGVFQGVSYRG